MGTAAIKVVIVDDQDRIVWAKTIPALPENIPVAGQMVINGLAALGLAQDSCRGIAATGYGKRIFPGAGLVVDEITAAACGVFRMSQGMSRTVINIGGQDIKVISIGASGKVSDFKMNDKCAAGTGRYLEMVARTMNMSISELGSVPVADGKVEINSTCAVFAESEIVSLLYRKIDKAEIASGVYRALARRTADFLHNFPIEDDVYLDGGPGQHLGLRRALEEEIAHPLIVLPEPQYSSAAGAALLLAAKLKV